MYRVKGTADMGETEKENGNSKLKKLRGETAEEYRAWKKEAEGMLLGLPNTVPEEKWGARLYNMVDKEAPAGELIEEYAPKDFLGKDGLELFWKIFDDFGRSDQYFDAVLTRSKSVFGIFAIKM